MAARLRSWKWTGGTPAASTVATQCFWKLLRRRGAPFAPVKTSADDFRQLDECHPHVHDSAVEVDGIPRQRGQLTPPQRTERPRHHEQPESLRPEAAGRRTRLR